MIILIGTQFAYTKHIIGGQMSYKCKGNDSYEFTLVLYRDCASGGAEFDSKGSATTGTVTVYRDDVTSPYIRTVRLGAPRVSRIPTDLDNPCLTVPPNLCVEEGKYVFNLELPKSDFSYHIVYQRCCRNGTILNIVRPEEVGATFTIELTPKAQELCTDSPVSNAYPPIAVCLGEYMNVDLSSSDDNPSTDITYEYCYPLDGGGVEGSTGTGNPNGPNGVAPDPDTRPPFTDVVFRTPRYSVNEPMGGDPIITVDPQTGVISGTPNQSGQFVVAICAIQSLNGEVLSVVRREFQFNVVECDRKVYADLGGYFSRDQSSITFKYCGPKVITFDNKSKDENFIKTYDWEFNLDGDIITSNERNPTINFRDTGVYNGIMVLNKEETGCNDSIKINIEIRNLIKADFVATLNSCEPNDVSYINNSITQNDGDLQSTWFIEEDTIISHIPDNYNYTTAGTKNIVLAVEDKYECYDTLSQELLYYPNPDFIGIDISNSLICTREEIKINNLTRPVNDEYDFYWELGDDLTSTEWSPSIIYRNEGVYSIRYKQVSPIGCEIDTTFSVPIRVLSKPVSLFDYKPENLSSLSKSIDLINLSEDADSYEWLLDYSFLSNSENPSYTFPDTGLHQIDLIALNNNGCNDTSTQIIDVVPISTYHLPNAFTPNNDGKNDLYLGRGYLEYVEDFKMMIFDRWGRLQFETTDPLEGWNGKYENTGTTCMPGVYVCKVSFKGARKKVVELESKVLLIQ